VPWALAAAAVWESFAAILLHSFGNADSE